VESPEALRQRVRQERRLRERLRLAARRLEAAQTERRWAIVSVHQQGLSLRQIAAATGLGATRIHQLLREAETDAIPARLSRLREADWPVPAPEGLEASGQDAARTVGETLAACLGEEAAALRECVDWLARLEREAFVAVNLRLEDDAEREYVPFDRPRVLRVLRRIADDLDDLARTGPAGEVPADLDAAEPHARHRRRLAEPPPVPRRLSAREERAALRAAAGLDPLP
jgi:hypothetical protein